MRLDSTSTSSGRGDDGGFSVMGDPNFGDPNFGDPIFGDPSFGDPGLGLVISKLYKFIPMVGDVNSIDSRVSSINLTPDQNTRGIGSVNFCS